ncbi:hypothetical protein PM082_007951 [Marasmius tenuissimus]|nr:hypothetical protein PM082_007951 [Marasmius tenuissimus]
MVVMHGPWSDKAKRGAYINLSCSVYRARAVAKLLGLWNIAERRFISDAQIPAHSLPYPDIANAGHLGATAYSPGVIGFENSSVKNCFAD